jgi:hypothetical protein
MPSNAYVKLEQRLVLAAWAAHKLGYSSNQAMLHSLREVEEGYDSNGRSYLVQAIVARGSKCFVREQDLELYDANILAHLSYFNRYRKERLVLRYFQHLCLLISELFLNYRFNHESELRRELKLFVQDRNRSHGPLGAKDPEFTDVDLRKLAFLMATGSGKTILMHFHYRQFLQYCKEPLDNILLVTPDEGLSQQHIQAMDGAGIPCGRFSFEDSGLEAVMKNRVRVIEITKLVEEKKGGGVSVPVEAFEGNNLIFVDEGHKGASSEAGRWIGYRDKLAQTGFTFEYSATFAQAMTAARDDEMTKEYGKAILFDYGYKYFYADGFGKDFELLNLRYAITPEQTRTLLLANLLSFYEQKRAFQTKSDEMVRYHLADPLWVFVGSTVNKSKENTQAKESDVLTVVKFLSDVLRNERCWVEKDIKRILGGDSGIKDEGVDVFSNHFTSLRKWSDDGQKIYRDLLKRVFHTAIGGQLHVGDIKGKAGELGLKVSGGEHYFGLVYIGDTAGFKVLIEAQCPEVEIEEDQIADGLFEDIKKPESRINVLIGAKKFMQGWDTWRVTNMGLLNIGRSEGSEIIQLFGRGVRLQGLNRSLKRSSALPGSHPTGINLLENLNIFAIRANYMTQFRDYLEREGVDPLGEVEFKLPIKRSEPFLKNKLITPRLPKESRFDVSQRIVLGPWHAVKVILDVSIRIQSIRSASGGYETSNYVGGAEHWLAEEQFPWLDWERLYITMLEFKEERGFHNLLVLPEHAREILSAKDPKLYGLICDDAMLRPTRVEEAARLQTVMGHVLTKYMESFYRKQQQRWDSSQMLYEPLRSNDDNFRDYVLKIPRSDKTLQTIVKDVVAEWKRSTARLSVDVPNVYFDRHLYQPLLIANGNKIRSAPPQLTESERRFVSDLVQLCKADNASLKGKELFLLRNLSRGKGVGFFEASGFYPDFMLWVRQGNKQRLVFVEPHGMQMEEHPSTNPKAHLHEYLARQLPEARRKSKNEKLYLDAYIISATPFDDLRKKHGTEWDKARYASVHILFFGDNGDRSYLTPIINGADVRADNNATITQEDQQLLPSGAV